MNQPAQSWNRLDKLILVAGHAVYVGIRPMAQSPSRQQWDLTLLPEPEQPAPSAIIL
ncbi:MAG: hypothetical protein ABSH34_04215 [Verrucomicrobiota bacterium]|jgi:hypothetical protein